MSHGNIGWRFGAYLVLTALLGCGEGTPATTPEPAALGDASTCEMIDMTAPDVARRLEGAKLTQLGEATVRYEGGRKISSAQVLVQGGKAAQSVGGEPDSSYKEVTITCTSSCNGNWCSGSGCNADAFGCSTYSCTAGCTGSCTKTSTYTPE